jgi:hypothetical protein
MHHGTLYDGEAWKSLDFTLAEHAKAHGEERCLIRCNRDLQDDPVPMLKFFFPVVNGEIIDHILGFGCGGQRSGISRQLFDWGGWRWIQPPFVRRQKVRTSGMTSTHAARATSQWPTILASCASFESGVVWGISNLNEPELQRWSFRGRWRWTLALAKALVSPSHRYLCLMSRPLAKDELT